MPSGDLDLSQLQTRLRDLPVGHTIDYHATIASTMPRAHALATEAEVSGGTLVLADVQSAGRGRLDRHWESPAGLALLVSVILKAPLLPATPALLPMMAGVAVVRAMTTVVPSTFGHTWLKWPNDVLLGSTPEEAAKVAGILIESTWAGGGLQSAILGIGVNANQLAGDLPTVPANTPLPGSLRLFAGAPVRRDDLLVALCTELSTLLSPAMAATTIYTDWREMLATLGRAVTVTRHGGGSAPLAGRAVDVTPAGELVVEDAAGTRHSFAAGDVSLRDPDA